MAEVQDAEQSAMDVDGGHAVSDKITLVGSQVVKVELRSKANHFLLSLLTAPWLRY